MTLLTSGRATGRRCPVCGSPDGSCQGAHAQTANAPVDVPTESQIRTPPDVIARRSNFGTIIEVLATEAEAKARGWEIVRYRDGRPYHKARPAPGPDVAAPVSPAPASPDVSDGKTPTLRELRARAKELGIAGRSRMSKDELAAAVSSAETNTEDPK